MRSRTAFGPERAGFTESDVLPHAQALDEAEVLVHHADAALGPRRAGREGAPAHRGG